MLCYSLLSPSRPVVELIKFGPLQAQIKINMRVSLEMHVELPSIPSRRERAYDRWCYDIQQVATSQLFIQLIDDE